MNTKQIYIKCKNCHNIITEEKCKKCGKKHKRNEIIDMIRKEMRIVIFKDISYNINIHDHKKEDEYIIKENVYK